MIEDLKRFQFRDWKKKMSMLMQFFYGCIRNTSRGANIFREIKSFKFFDCIICMPRIFITRLRSKSVNVDALLFLSSVPHFPILLIFIVFSRDHSRYSNLQRRSTGHEKWTQRHAGLFVWRSENENESKQEVFIEFKIFRNTQNYFDIKYRKYTGKNKWPWFEQNGIHLL